MAKAYLLAALTGAVILALVQYAALPALARNLSSAQIAWLRSMFMNHPIWVLLTIVVVTAVLGLPVLLAALWAGRLGPWRDRIENPRA